MLELESIPTQTHWCTVRRLDDGYVVYNTRTDELHVLPPVAHYAYALCDSTRTVAAVAELLRGSRDAPSARGRVLHFLRALEERGIVTAANG